MKIQKIEIINYKSLKDKKNILFLDDEITTIIGVNECGKSNVIESIAIMDLLNGCDEKHKSSINISCSSQDNISVNFYLIDNDKETILKLKPGYYASIEGSMEEELLNNQKISLFVNELEQVIKKAATYRNNYDNQRRLLNSQHVLFGNIDERINNVFSTFNKDNFTDDAQSIIEEYKNIYFKVPKIVNIPIKFEDLKATYSYDDIIKSKPDDFIRKLIELATITIDDIRELKAATRGKEQTLKNKLEEKLSVNIKGTFEKYYNHPDFNLYFSFDNNSLNIFGKTDDNFVPIDERSQGLRWYFMMFVYMQSLSVKHADNCVYLFDEPGIYLHVNAQKELLEFFESLAKENSQVIYSTHSPYMINKNKLQSLRPIIKTTYGETEIHNNIFSGKISLTNKHNTLAPVFACIGYDLKNSCFSDGDLNVLVEGITDKLILDALNESYYNKKVNFIPCGGVNNIHNVLSLVIGFGYDFIILMDNDGAGRKEETKLINSFGFYVDDKIKYINCTEADKSIEFCIEDNITQNDKDKMTIKSITSDNSKKMFTLEFHSKVCKKMLDLSEETKANFDKIFNLLERK